MCHAKAARCKNQAKEHEMAKAQAKAQRAKAKKTHQ